MTATATRKTSKAALREAVDSFLWKLDWITGGTRDETLKQAPGAIADLEARAALCVSLASNPSKPCAADSHLMGYALELIPSRLESYRSRWLTPAAAPEASQAALEAASAILGCEVAEILAGAETLTAQPENVIFHNFKS